VPHDRCEQADLGLVEAELVFAELVVFLDGPAAAGDGNQHGEGGRDVLGDEAVEVSQL
jgi:hypothetical protein